MTDAIDVDIQNLNFENLTISKPKKTEDSLFGSMALDNNRLNIHYYNVEVMKHTKIRHLTKYYTVLFLKVSKTICKKMLEFDSHCVDQVRDNISGWFAKALDENVIEEYYTNSVSICKSNGFVLKLKLQGGDDILESGKYNLIVSLKGLRFYKQRFIPEWEIVGAERLEEDFLNSIVEDDDDVWKEEDTVEVESLPEPTEEEMFQIVDGLRERISHDKNDLVSKYKSLKHLISQYKGLEDELDEFINSKSTKYYILDEISEKLEQLNVK